MSSAESSQVAPSPRASPAPPLGTDAAGGEGGAVPATTSAAAAATATTAVGAKALGRDDGKEEELRFSAGGAEHFVESAFGEIAAA